ncbi:hypothetical protein ACFP3I_00025 [Chryseobacterium arachidis]|uniref:hypothetical protein n=1 Tax=Chryseobacterium arachidis TaxID=1416778 RepID=UPI00361CAC53
MKMKTAITVFGILCSIMTWAQQDSISISTDSLEVQKDSILISNSDESVADQNKKNNIWNRLKYDVSAMAGGFANAYTRPLSWEKKDYLRLGATAAAVGWHILQMKISVVL